MIREVHLSKQAEKDLKKVPKFLVKKFSFWVDSISEIGLSETKKLKGFRDEALKGNRRGQYSIRLNVAYRAIYQVQSGTVTFVQVLEVNKHDY